MKNKLFILTYRFGSSAYPNTLYFEFVGSVPEKTNQEAIQRGRTFCETVGYRFHSVRPFISDLKSIEQRHLGIDTNYPSQPKQLEQ